MPCFPLYKMSLSLRTRPAPLSRGCLPDQDQAECSHQRTIAGPLDLVDHEASFRPRNQAGALADPQQPDGQREQADDQKQSAHDVPPTPPVVKARYSLAGGNRSFRSAVREAMVSRYARRQEIAEEDERHQRLRLIK